MKRIWLDVTDFMEWKGNFTGLQRIQYNIAKRYIQNKYDIHFFVYTVNREFVAIDFVPEKIVEAGVIDIQKQKKIKRDGGIVSAFTRKIERLSDKQGLRRLTKKIGTNPKPKQSPFSEGDIVLILGGIWFGDFIHDLAKEKKRKNFKLVHFIHDMIPVLQPGFVVEGLPEAFRKYKSVVFSIADNLIANSKSTRNDALDFMKQLGIPKKNIDVVRIGEDVSGDDQPDSSLEKITGTNFILCVGTVEGRKNHAALFYLVKEAKAKKINIPLIVIVGRTGWLTDDIRYVMTHDLDTKDAVIFLEGINDHQLSWLYRNCVFTIYPSFYEGWGMPIAESLSYGKLCLASNTSSMPEIAGDLIAYFSPFDTGEMLRVVQKYLDKDTRHTMEQAINSRYRPTTWDKMFESINSSIEKV